MQVSQQARDLASRIAEATFEDQKPENGGCDISAGLFGPNLSELIQHLANQRAT